MLDDTSLAIAMLTALRVRHIAIGGIALRRVDISITSAVDIQLLHPSGERMSSVRRSRGSARGCEAICRVEASAIRARRRCTARRSYRCTIVRRCGVGSCSCHGRSEWSSTCLEGRVDRREDSGLLAAGIDIVVVGQLASMPDWYCTSRDAADASIMVMEMLLSVVICTAVHHRGTGRVLDSRDIISRIGTLELGRRVDCLGSTRALIRAFRNVLKIKGMTNGRRAASNVARIASLAGGRPVDGRHAVLGTMPIYAGSPIVGSPRFRIRRGGQSKIKSG